MVTIMRIYTYTYPEQPIAIVLSHNLLQAKVALLSLFSENTNSVDMMSMP